MSKAVLKLCELELKINFQLMIWGSRKEELKLFKTLLRISQYRSFVTKGMIQANA